MWCSKGQQKKSCQLTLLPGSDDFVETDVGMVDFFFTAGNGFVFSILRTKALVYTLKDDGSTYGCLFANGILGFFFSWLYVVPWTVSVASSLFFFVTTGRKAVEHITTYQKIHRMVSRSLCPFSLERRMFMGDHSRIRFRSKPNLRQKKLLRVLADDWLSSFSRLGSLWLCWNISKIFWICDVGYKKRRKKHASLTKLSTEEASPQIAYANLQFPLVAFSLVATSTHTAEIVWHSQFLMHVKLHTCRESIGSWTWTFS